MSASLLMVVWASLTPAAIPSPSAVPLTAASAVTSSTAVPAPAASAVTSLTAARSAARRLSTLAPQEPQELRIPAGARLRASMRGKTAAVDVIGCAEISGTLSLGEGDFTLNVRLSEALQPLDPDEDDDSREGMCHYVGLELGAAQIRTAGLGAGDTDFAIAPDLRNLDVSIYSRMDVAVDEPSAIAEIGLSWNDSETDQFPLELARFGISFKLYSFGATFANDDNAALTMSSGFVAVQLNAEGDTRLQGPVYLGGGVASLLVYSWTDDTSDWTAGSWNLSGMGQMRLEVRRDGRVPIAAMLVGFDSNTMIATGQLDLTSSTSWEIGGFDVRLERSSLMARMNLRDDTWSIEEGEIVGRITAQRPIGGDLTFRMRWTRGRFEMAIDSNSTMTAFGVDCEELALRADLDTETLEFHEIGGSLAFKHTDFDASIRIASFLVREGELVTFLGSGRVSYKNFVLNVTRLSYDAQVQPRELALSASMDLGWSQGGGGAIDVKDLKIDEAGEISSFSIGANLNAAPVEITFGATFDKERALFSGRFAGYFAGTGGLSGTVLVGAVPPPDDFSYGYMAIAFNFERGIPIGQSGLVLVGLNGAFGFNYLPPGAPGASPTAGEPRQNTYYLAGGLTVGDVGGLASLQGELRVVLGATTGVGISGTLQVTRGTPYFVGTVTANYVLGSGAVNGTLLSSVRLPSSGSVVYISNNMLVYNVGSGSWTLRGANLGGTFFSFLDVSRGNLSLTGTLRSPVSSMSGSLGAYLSGSSRATWSYPDGYTPWGDGDGDSCSVVNTGGLQLDCDCSGDSDDSLGFGLAGGFSTGLSGNITARLDSAGSSGTMTFDANLSGSVGFTTPASGWFGVPCAHVGSVTAYGRLTGVNRDGSLDVSGTLTFSTSSGYSKDLQFGYVF